MSCRTCQSYLQWPETMVEVTLDSLRSLPLYLYLILSYLILSYLILSYLTMTGKSARLFTRTRIVMSGAENQWSVVLYGTV